MTTLASKVATRWAATSKTAMHWTDAVDDAQIGLESMINRLHYAGQDAKRDGDPDAAESIVNARKLLVGAQALLTPVNASRNASTTKVAGFTWRDALADIVKDFEKTYDKLDRISERAADESDNDAARKIIEAIRHLVKAKDLLEGPAYAHVKHQASAKVAVDGLLRTEMQQAKDQARMIESTLGSLMSDDKVPRVLMRHLLMNAHRLIDLLNSASMLTN